MPADDRDALPLPDYDHLTTGDLTGRVRALPAEDVRQLLDHERAHGNRAPVVAVLEERLRQLESGGQTSGGDPAAARPQAAPPPAGGSAVGPETAAGPASAPPHGVPAQPAQPKGDRPTG